MILYGMSMRQGFSVLNILGVTFLFFLTTMLSFGYGFDVFKANFILFTAYMMYINPFELSIKKMGICFGAGIILFGLFFFLNAKIYCPIFFSLFMILMLFMSNNKNDYNLSVFIIAIAVMFNLNFISCTRIGDVQYDFASCYNYIEYILDNNFMFWNENPILTRPSYSDYHPILHFFIGAIAIRLGTLMSFSVEAANEGMQIVFLFYMLWYYIICSKILKTIGLNGIVYIAMLSYVSMFPSYNAISGFINNDALLLPMCASVIYYSLLYHINGDKKSLSLIVLFATLASLTKLSGILVLGATGLVFLYKLLKNRNKNTFIEIFVASFLILVGISIWPIYQYFVLDIGLGYVPPQEQLSLKQYTLWEIFNPLRAFVYERIFYNYFGPNLWETMTKTALFGQWDFSYRGNKIMWLIVFDCLLYKIILGTYLVGLLYLMLKKYKDFNVWFVVLLILGIIGGQIAFGLKHPYMCNQDFRYVAILSLLIAMVIGLFTKKLPNFVKYSISVIIFMFSLSSMVMWWWIAW